MKKISKLIMGLTIVLGLVGGLGTEANAEVIRTNDYKSQVVNFKENLPINLRNVADKVTIKMMGEEEYISTLKDMNAKNTGKEFVGNTLYNSKTEECWIFLKDTGNVEMDYDTFTHELFHVYDNFNDITSSSDGLFKSIYSKEKGIFRNEYYDGNIREFFAEAGSWYMNPWNNSYLQVAAPETYNFIEKVLLG